MTSKHTPGPWKFERGNGRYMDTFYVTANAYSTPAVRDGRDQIVQLNASCKESLAQEREANARLIAEAPAMLEALRNAVPLLEGFEEADDAMRDDDEEPIVKPVLDEARAILDRIGGEE